MATTTDLDKVETMLLQQATAQGTKLDTDFIELVRQDITILESDPASSPDLTQELTRAAEKLIIASPQKHLDKQALINFKYSAFDCKHAYACDCWKKLGLKGLHNE